MPGPPVFTSLLLGLKALASLSQPSEFKNVIGISEFYH